MHRLLFIVLAALPACSNGCKGDQSSQSGASASASASTSASSKPPPFTPEQLAAASDVVVAYYAAVAAGDCVTLPKLIDPPLSNEDCKKAVDDAKEHGSDFDRIMKCVPDGRDPTTALVTVRLASGKGPRDQLVRVKNDGGVWKVQP